jgi:hypothetical protein
LAAAIAYLFSIFLGVDLIHSGKLGELVRTDDSYYSLFHWTLDKIVSCDLNFDK